MEQSKRDILCIDDDNDTCDLIEFMFKQIGYRVTSCATAQEGVSRARIGGYEAIILDNRFADSDGAKVCREIREFDSETPIIFFTGEARTAEKDKAIEAGANEYLIKPNDLDKLTDTIVNLITPH